MDLKSNLPIIENPNAAKYGYATKLVPVFVDGVQSAWEQVHINSKVTSVHSNSPEALRAKGYAVPFVDYDPIQRDLEKRSTQSRFKPVWTGD